MSQVSDSFQPTSFSPTPLPILKIKFNVQRPNGALFEIMEEFYVDTGFTGDLKLPQSLGSRLKGMGIGGITELVTVANGITKNEIFQAEITEIVLNNTNILTGSQPCTISCMGGNNTANLVGLNALRNWKICMDLPQQILSIE